MGFKGFSRADLEGMKHVGDALDAAIALARIPGEIAKQTKFASAVALTRTAQDAQAKLREDLFTQFVVRGKRVVGGVRIQPAKKTKLTAEVGHLDWYMAIQGEGGVKVKARRVMARPVGIRKNPKARTPRSKWPANLLRKDGHFVQQMKTGKVGVLKRVGDRRLPIKLLYTFEDRVEIPKRWPLEGTAGTVAKLRLAGHFERELGKALIDSWNRKRQASFRAGK